MIAEYPLSEVRRHHETAAILAAMDPVYLPVFERMEAELSEAEVCATTDPIAKARRRAEARRLTS